MDQYSEMHLQCPGQYLRVSCKRSQSMTLVGHLGTHPSVLTVCMCTVCTQNVRFVNDFDQRPSAGRVCDRRHVA
jgi:hypothetical protein